VSAPPAGRGVAGVAAASGLAALALAGVGATAWAPVVHHGPAGGHAHAATGLAAAAWLVGWGLMAAATMLPVTAPVVRRSGRPAGVAAGFLAAWAALGAGVLAGVWALGAAGAPDAPAAGIALLLAGAFQLSPAKARLLARCRDHARLFTAGGGDPTGDAVRAGLAQGRASVACCGPLMAAMALGAVGGAVPMLAAGAAMATEAAAPWGTRITRPLGAALLVAGVLALA
jgi:predicted metal-binding membrane protein